MVEWNQHCYTAVKVFYEKHKKKIQSSKSKHDGSAKQTEQADLGVK